MKKTIKIRHSDIRALPILVNEWLSLHEVVADKINYGLEDCTGQGIATIYFTEVETEEEYKCYCCKKLVVKSRVFIAKDGVSHCCFDCY